jgi:hypothetical protein
MNVWDVGGQKSIREYWSVTLFSSFLWLQLISLLCFFFLLFQGKVLWQDWCSGLCDWFCWQEKNTRNRCRTQLTSERKEIGPSFCAISFRSSFTHSFSFSSSPSSFA